MDFLIGPIDFKEKLKERDTIITIVLVVAFVVGFSGYKIYKWHNNKIQSQAQRSFSESMEMYKSALSSEFNNKDVNSSASKNKEGVWDGIDVSFRVGFEENKKSTLAPFFLTFESDAQIRLGKIDEAYKNLTEAVERLQKNSPYYYLYNIKLALLDFDKGDVEKGVVLLHSLINDKNNIFKDMASFYLGEYFWSINDLDKAKENFQISLAYNPESTWGNLSKMRLEKMKY